MVFTVVATLSTYGRDAHASAFIVNTQADAVDAAPGDGTCATAEGACSLRAAIQEANELVGPDSISVPAGTYVLTGASGENAAATGDLDITADVAIDGVGIGVTIVDAGQLDRVFDVVGGSASISGMTMRNGRSDPNDGGAVHNVGTLTLSDVAIEDSHGDDGGAIANSGTATVLDSTLTQNSAADTGGAIVNHGTLTVRRTAVDTNTAPFGGGGINSFGTLTISESLIAHNQSMSGNGAGLASFALATLTNVTISDNDAGTNGAGVASESSLVLSSVTIADNTANGVGSGLFTNASGVQFRNTIIAGNTDDQCAGSGGYISQGNNISSAKDCLFGAGGDLQNANPMLGALGDNGGPTHTHALLDGSPAIDHALTLGGCPPTDQRGVPRPQNGQCDIGAYEAGAVPTATPAATNTPEATPTSPPVDTPTPTDLPIASATPTATPTGLHKDIEIGDANCDGSISSLDAAIVLQMVAGFIDPDDYKLCGPDANRDGDINSIDAALILQYSAGLLTQLPP